MWKGWGKRQLSANGLNEGLSWESQEGSKHSGTGEVACTRTGILGSQKGWAASDSWAWSEKVLMDMVMPRVRMVETSTFKKSPKETEGNHCSDA